jgi:hypothetical protein
MERRIPLIFCIDVEPDDHVYPPGNPSPWSGFEALAAESAGLRDRLSALTGEPARLTWSLRLDPQIAEAYGDPAWIIDHHRDFFEEARGLGDAVGVHPHAWRWDRERRVWISDQADAAWVDHCIEMSFETYRSRFGEAPSHHRFGGRFVSEGVLAAAHRLGARFDLTLEPGKPGKKLGERYGAIWTGEIPDFGKVPRIPYHPDPADFRRPARDGVGGLWTIPLSSGRFVPKRRSRRQHRIARRLSHPVRMASGLARRLDRARRSVGGDRRPPYKPLAMWLDWRSPADFWNSAFASLEELEYPYLAFAIRSDIGIRSKSKAGFEGIVASLFEHREAKRLVFTTPEDALRRLGLHTEDPSGP